MKLKPHPQNLLRFSALFITLILGMLTQLQANVTLQWNENTEPDLAGYQVFLGTEPGVYTHSIDVGFNNEASLSNLEPNTTYYAVISAYDVYLIDSPFSDEISFTTKSSSQDLLSITVERFELTIDNNNEPYVNFTIQGEINNNIQVLASDDLEQWTPIGSQINTNGTISIRDIDSIGKPRRFYKLMN